MGSKPRPYNNGKWTQARMAGFLRSVLRRASMRWGPRNEAFNAARRPYKGRDKRRRYEWLCAKCRKWFKRAEVQADHVTECGRLVDPFGDLGEFARRLFCDAGGYQILCKKCHKKKTNNKQKRKMPFDPNNSVTLFPNMDKYELVEGQLVLKTGSDVIWLGPVSAQSGDSMVDGKRKEFAAWRKTVQKRDGKLPFGTPFLSISVQEPREQFNNANNQQGTTAPAATGNEIPF